MTQTKDGLEPDNDGLGDVSSAVQACVSYYGAHDWSTWGAGPGSTAEDKAAGEKGSTIKYVYKDDPPMFVIHGDKDRTVPVGQSRKLVAVLKQVGAKYEYWEVPGVDHSSCLNGKIKGDDERVKKFLQQYLGRK